MRTGLFRDSGNRKEIDLAGAREQVLEADGEEERVGSATAREDKMGSN